MSDEMPAPGGLKLLIDTAEVSTWERYSSGFYGVTTNPKLD
jgi:hypothetical protein